jgi:hypothetical protein
LQQADAIGFGHRRDGEVVLVSGGALDHLVGLQINSKESALERISRTTQAVKLLIVPVLVAGTAHTIHRVRPDECQPRGNAKPLAVDGIDERGERQLPEIGFADILLGLLAGLAQRRKQQRDQ